MLSTEASSAYDTRDFFTQRGHRNGAVATPLRSQSHRSALPLGQGHCSFSFATNLE